jgi:hypothetical protein
VRGVEGADLAGVERARRGQVRHCCIEATCSREHSGCGDVKRAKALYEYGQTTAVGEAKVASLVKGL